LATLAPRAVFVSRETDYELLLANHSTRDQAEFFLKSRGQKLADVERRHERFHQVLAFVRAHIPKEWRSASVGRSDLDRFLFAPEDVVVVVGQDGLVANAAKYLRGQSVLGINPDPRSYDGILVPLSPERGVGLLRATAHGDARLQSRTMIEATLDDGQTLVALNEIFVGHRSHQSARYELDLGDKHEVQSSSGIIVSSGTGATGWARSIMEVMHQAIPLKVDEAAVAYFVREPFPSVSTGTSIRAGKIGAPQHLFVVSRMNQGGVIFADGVEQDRLAFDWGRRAQVGVSGHRLNLVQP
jgi:NAD kinase